MVVSQVIRLPEAIANTCNPQHPQHTKMEAKLNGLAQQEKKKRLLDQAVGQPSMLNSLDASFDPSSKTQWQCLPRIFGSGRP